MTKARDLATSGPSTGLVLIKPGSVVNGTDNGNGTISFSNVSGVSLNDVFTSTYRNYRIIASYQGTGGSQDMFFRVRASGTDLSTATYEIARYYVGLSQSQAAGSTNNVTVSALSIGIINNDWSSFSCDIFEPQTARQTTCNSVTSSWLYNLTGGIVNNTTSYDGFTIYPSSGNMTGIVQVYGYKE